MHNDWRPTAKYELYLQKIDDILGEEKRTVRDIYYALEARGFPDELAQYGHEFDYRNVKRAVKKGRRHGYIDPNKVIDTSRQAVTTQRESHSSPESFLRSQINYIKNGYFENFWDDQPTYVEVWLEKASLSSVFSDICDSYNVRLEATRGDWSDSKINQATKRIVKQVQDGNDVKILYFGDFNPSGLHAPVAVQKTMGYYGLEFPRNFEDDRDYFDIWPFHSPLGFDNEPGTVEFDRKALNKEHIERFDLPENPTPSSSDKDRTLKERFMEHASDGRDVNIELNALKEYQRDFLEALLEDSIEEHIDESKRKETNERVESVHERLESAVDADYSVLD